MEQPALCAWLINLLKAVSKDRKRVEVFLKQVIASIDTIKLVKKGADKK